MAVAEVILIPLTASVALLVDGARRSPIRLLEIVIDVVAAATEIPFTTPVALLLCKLYILFLLRTGFVPAECKMPVTVDAPVVLNPLILLLENVPPRQADEVPIDIPVIVPPAVILLTVFPFAELPIAP